MNAQGGEGTPSVRNLRIGEEDERFIRDWYWDVCGDKDFERNYLKFMGALPTDDEPPPGRNRRILAVFLNNRDNRERMKDRDDRERMLAKYLLELYHHQASGDRADSEDWFWHLAFLVGLGGLAMVFLVEFLQRVHAERWDWPSWDWLSWFILLITLLYVVAGVAFYKWADRIIGRLKNRKKHKGR